jgi:hypothetical protein
MQGALVWNARSRDQGGRRLNHGRQTVNHQNGDLHPSSSVLLSLADTTDSRDMAQRTEVQPMLYEPGYEVQSGHEGDDACWLDAVIEREAELEEEGFRASFAGSDPDLCSSVYRINWIPR